MTRLYGRALRSERVNDYVPDVRFERASVISSMRLSGKAVPVVFKGTLNGELFRKYISDCLAPTVKTGDILVLDNLAVHKVAGAVDAIYRRGASVLFLPPYSPDFNPIELSWSKMKAALKRLKPRTYGELVSSLKTSLGCFTRDDIKNWFTHDGYV